MARTPAFDASRMSNASKILLGGGVLLFVDSFLTWERDCQSLSGVEPPCVDVHSMWAGSGGIFGLLAGLLVLALIVWEALHVAGVAAVTGLGGAPRIGAVLGFGVLALVLIKFVFVLTHAALGAWLGLALGLAVGYGAWMRLQEPATAGRPSPPSPTTNGGMSS